MASIKISGFLIFYAAHQYNYKMQNNQESEKKMMKFAVPVTEGKLSMHFGHSKEFAIIEMDDNKMISKEIHEPPPHKPGVLPEWLNELEVNIIIAGGMGESAIKLFEQKGITVVTGAPGIGAEELVLQYLNNTLLTVNNSCGHGGCNH